MIHNFAVITDLWQQPDKFEAPSKFRYNLRGF